MEKPLNIWFGLKLKYLRVHKYTKIRYLPVNLETIKASEHYLDLYILPKLKNILGRILKLNKKSGSLIGKEPW